MGILRPQIDACVSESLMRLGNRCVPVKKEIGNGSVKHKVSSERLGRLLSDVRTSVVSSPKESFRVTDFSILIPERRSAYPFKQGPDSIRSEIPRLKSEMMAKTGPSAWVWLAVAPGISTAIDMSVRD